MKTKRFELRLTEEDDLLLEKLSREQHVSKSEILKRSLYTSPTIPNGEKVLLSYIKICKLLENKQYDQVEEEVFNLCLLFNSLTNPIT